MERYQFSLGFWAAFVAATLLFRSYRGGLFFIAAFPGTLAHELTHYVAALLLRGQPQSINLVPKKQKDGGWTLGSVTFYANWWNGSFVALAPLLLLPVAWLCACHAGSLGWHGQLILGYGAGCIANSALPSSADWKVVREYPLGFFLVLLVVALLWQMRHVA
jgi:hypothetical protein